MRFRPHKVVSDPTKSIFLISINSRVDLDKAEFQDH